MFGPTPDTVPATARSRPIGQRVAPPWLRTLGLIVLGGALTSGIPLVFPHGQRASSLTYSETQVVAANPTRTAPDRSSAQLRMYALIAEGILIIAKNQSESGELGSNSRALLYKIQKLVESLIHK